MLASGLDENGMSVRGRPRALLRVAPKNGMYTLRCWSPCLTAVIQGLYVQVFFKHPYEFIARASAHPLAFGPVTVSHCPSNGFWSLDGQQSALEDQDERKEEAVDACCCNAADWQGDYPRAEDLSHDLPIDAIDPVREADTEHATDGRMGR